MIKKKKKPIIKKKTIIKEKITVGNQGHYNKSINNPIPINSSKLDHYKCVKIPLDKILRDPQYQSTIMDCVRRINKITIKTYQLLKLWVLDSYHKKQEVPIITKEVVGYAQKSFLQSSSGSKGSHPEKIKEFKLLHQFPLEDAQNISDILQQYTNKSIVTSIETNIKVHFLDYLKSFLYSFFFNKYQDKIQNPSFKAQLKKDIRKIQNDIINNTQTSPKCYHPWIKQHRLLVLPKEPRLEGHYYGIQAYPQRYLKHMIWMNIQLESIGKKMFNFLPLRTQIIPKHIKLDTKNLILVLIGTDKESSKIVQEIVKSNNSSNPFNIINKTGLKQSFKEYKNEIWNYFFKIDIPIKHYYFDHSIQTDGYSASISFIHEDQHPVNEATKDLRSQGHKETKGLSKEARRKRQEIKQQAKEQKLEASKESKSTKQSKFTKQDKKKKDHEFLYIDEVNKEDLEGPCIYIDPGKRDLLTIINDDGTRMVYSNKERMHWTKRLKYQKNLKTIKDNLGITAIEGTLSQFNSKTCNLNDFKKYIDEKNKVNDQLFSLYEDPKFRQYQWYSYINKKRADKKMVKKIQRKFGKDVKLIYGDWSIGKQMRNFVSTPNIHIKRVLKKYFSVYNIDEYRTSKLHHETEEELSNLQIINKKNQKRVLYAVRTYKKGVREGCINRDYNACLNMRKLFNWYLKKGTRPEKYSRSKNEKNKGVNPSLSDVST